MFRAAARLLAKPLNGGAQAMEFVDPGVWVGLGLTLLLLAFVGAFYLMRDQEPASERHLQVLVACPVDRQPAKVTFTERRQGGLVTRRVDVCSLRASNKTCLEQCLWHVRV
jgi:hypothetical protein